MSLSKGLSVARGRGEAFAHILSNMYERYKDSPPASLHPILPLLFMLNGSSVSLDDFPTMEPLFDVNPTKELTLMCSRQVGKSLTVSMRTIVNSAWTDHWKPLLVTPTFEQTRRMSTDYFASLIDQSPAKSLFTNSSCTKQVLERSFPNYSRIRFTYAHRNGDRARGIPANEVIYDEAQLMFPEVMAVVNATMNASPSGHIITCAGTPLTNANILSRRFREQSSRSHWAIKCPQCSHWNIAAEEYDLMAMIGPLTRDISRDRPGIRCSKCFRPLHPWTGRFIHLNPSKRKDHLGLHVPCIVLPMHCCHFDKWKDIHRVVFHSGLPRYTILNETLGVPCDDGVTLLTQAVLERQGVLNRNTVEDALTIANGYAGRIVIGIDWGGQGMSGESKTKIAVCGLSSRGTVDVIFGIQLDNTGEAGFETQVVLHLWKIFKAKFIAHDNIGIGARCEEMLVQAGVPLTTLLPMEYVGETQGMILKARKTTAEAPRQVYNVDKTRGLLHLVTAYQQGFIRTFQFEKAYQAESLLLDFTHLRAETKIWINSHKSETVLIQREPGQSDDFAHAVHHGANALWEFYRAWPKFKSPLIIQTPQDLSHYLSELARHMSPEMLEMLGMQPLDTSA